MAHFTTRIHQWYAGQTWSRSTNIAFVVTCALANMVFAVFVGHGFLEEVPPGTSTSGVVAAWIALLSTVIMIHAAALAVALLITAWLRSRKVVVIIAGVIFTLANILIYLDIFLYKLNDLHFGGLVWNLFYTPGASDSLLIPEATAISAGIGTAFIVVAEALLTMVVALPSVARRCGRKFFICTGILAALTVLADKIVYAVGDLQDNVETGRVSLWFPFYQEVTIRRWAMKFGYQPSESEGRSISFDAGNSTLAYPKEVALPQEPKRWNVVIIAVEGGRYDMLNPEVMPYLYAWSQSHAVCARHYSGGNCTRFGIFSLLYGLNGTYWWQFLAERRSPFLIDQLSDWGYSFKILSCTDLDFPEFRKTAFVSVTSSIVDKWKCERHERDRQMTDQAVKFLAEKKEPFFSFCFYDASHATYNYPPEHEVFKPAVALDKIDYFRMADDKSVANLLPVFNRYRNSLHYIDGQIARILKTLEQEGLSDRTLVFITGDHGEEFGELGKYGHNGTFDRYQIQSFMTFAVPGQGAKTIERMTSHVDVVPTILSALGVESDPAGYSQGLPLTGSQEHARVMSAGWNWLAIIDAKITTVMSSHGSKPSFHDQDYREVPKDQVDPEERRAAFADLLKGMRQFKR